MVLQVQWVDEVLADGLVVLHREALELTVRVVNEHVDTPTPDGLHHCIHSDVSVH